MLKNTIYFIMICVVLNNCTKYHESPSVTNNLATIENTITINMKEDSLSDTILVFDASTGIYSSLYPIIYEKEIKVKNINIDFLGVDTNAHALAMVGPAKARIEIGKLELEDYSINFNANGTLDTFNLMVSDSFYKVNGDTTGKVKFYQDSIGR